MISKFVQTSGTLNDKINAELQESIAEKKEEENEEARKKKLEEAEVLRKIGESRKRRAA